MYPAKDSGGNKGLEQKLTTMGLRFEPTTGSYGGGLEHSYIIHGPTREQMYQLGHEHGQHAVIYSQNGNHELLMTHGPDAGKYHPSLPVIRYSKDAPEDYYTALPGRGHVTLHFAQDKLLDSPVKHTMPAHAGGPAGHPEQQQLQAMKHEIATGLLAILRKAQKELS